MKLFLTRKYHEVIPNISRFVLVHHVIIGETEEESAAQHFMNVWFDVPKQKFYAFDTLGNREFIDQGTVEGIRWLSFFLTLLGGFHQ